MDLTIARVEGEVRLDLGITLGDMKKWEERKGLGGVEGDTNNPSIQCAKAFMRRSCS